jgi:hypothetical protein
MPDSHPFTSKKLTEETENIDQMILSIYALPDDSVPETTKSSLKQDLEMLKLILKKSNQNQNISKEASNFDQFTILRNNLLEQLKKIQADFRAPAEEVEEAPNIKNFKESLKTFEETQLPAYAKMIQGTVNVNLKDIEKILPHLNWIPEAGGKAKFYGPESLSEFIGGFCAYMKKTNCQSVNFTIYLPPATEEEHKKMEKNPNERIHEYAKKAFGAAAKEGFDPSNVKLEIDNKTINCTDEAFKADLKEWQSTAKKVNDARLENTRGNLAKAEPFIAKDKTKQSQDKLEGLPPRPR